MHEYIGRLVLRDRELPLEEDSEQKELILVDDEDEEDE